MGKKGEIGSDIDLIIKNTQINTKPYTFMSGNRACDLALYRF